ncbi:type IV secretion system protein [Desertibacillus haloalkaliphilus]|uniref:type IV secretion system protein n=1 Tax=Desertibacillus haloalkaliphilus TaxID=1328930 RepID=UPI001C272882|nr:type IV secretion system protein [Desertibacillus haloalkaliphilus]MBU8908094.1 type IV secretion system protein [Desertibacillus haloalkaliphilus]
MFGISDKIMDILDAIFTWMYEALIQPFTGLKSFQDLVFGRDNDNELVYGTFTQEEIQVFVSQAVDTTMILTGFFILVGIMYQGMRISSYSINPAARTSLIEFLKDLFIVAVLVFNIPYVYDFILSFNWMIVNLFSSAYEADFMNFNEDLNDSLKASGDTGDYDLGGGILGWALINLCLLGLAIWANFYYMMRKLTLLILMILGPVMISLWMFPQFKGITIGYFKELTGSIFVQAIHAFTFWMVAGIAVTSGNVIESVILYLIFIPVSEALRSLIGLGGQMNNTLSKAGAMMGMASIAGMYGAVKGAYSDKSVMGSIREAYSGQKAQRDGKGSGTDNDDITRKETLAGNTDSNTGTTTASERMLKAGDITSRAGKAVLGSAGAIAGATMGPGGAIALSTAGHAVGGATGGLVGRTGMAIGEGIAKRGKKGWDAGLKAFASSTENGATEDLAENIADDNLSKWETANKDEMINNFKERFPDATPQEINAMYGNERKKQYSAFKKQAGANLASIKGNDSLTAKASDLSEQTADNMAEQWAMENKDQFSNKYMKENPNASVSDMERAFNGEVGNKRKQFRAATDRVASDLAEGKSLEQAYINKSDFANLAGESMYNSEREAFKEQTVKSGTTKSNEEIEAIFDSKNADKKQMFVDTSHQTASNIQGAKLFSKGGVEKDYLVNQLASQTTAQQKQAFINTEVNSGRMTEDQAVQKWDSSMASKAFEDNTKQIASNIDSYAPKNRVMGKAGIAKGIGVGMASATGVSSVAGSTQKAFQNVSQHITSGIEAEKDQEMPASVGGKLVETTKGTISGLSAAYQEGKEGISNHLNTGNVVGKQESFQKGLGYVGGTVFGVAGYQKGTRLGAKFNPYTDAVQQQTKEVSQIQQMAQTRITEGGKEVIADGAVQQVVTSDASYIQVKDKTGQTQVVSRKGSGDSSLPKGEAIYQDLNINNGTLTPKQPPQGYDSSFYKKDSSGGKVLINRPINVDPNSLVTNLGQQQSTERYQPYSQKVDSGQFYINEIKEQVNDNQVRVVTQREHSYLVSKDDTGREYRISPYGKGDPNLKVGQTVYTDCHIENRRIREDRTYEVNEKTGQRVEVNHKTIDPNELVPRKPNPRIQKRQRNEQYRHKQGAGGDE